MTAPWQRSWLKSKNNPLIFVRDVLGATPELWKISRNKVVMVPRGGVYQSN